MHRSLILILFIIPFVSKSANRYWVNSGASNWNNIANWSTGSGGGGGASVPGSSDIAIFDGAGGFNGNCSIDAAVNVAGFTISGYSGTISQGANTITVGTSNFSMSSGVFTGGSVTIDINGNYTLSGGAFTSTTATLFIGGARSANATLLTHSSGTFAYNNGTVKLDPDGGCGSHTFTLDIITSSSFYNFIVDNPQGCGYATITTAAGDTLDIRNDFTHTSAVLNSVLEVKGNIVIGAGADGGSGKIILNGTGAQTYSAPASPPRTGILEINKSSGTVMPLGGTIDFSIQAFYQFAGDFTAPSGTFYVGGNWGSNLTIFAHASGAFNHNNGTTRFDPNGGCSSITTTVDVLTSTSFYNVAFDNPQSCGFATLVTSGSDTINVTNNFEHNGGAINGIFEIKGNLTIGSGTDGGSGKIILNGTGAQTYSAPASPPRTGILEINKSSGAVTPLGGTTDFSVQSFYQLAGDFTAPSGTFYVGGSLGSNSTIFMHASGTYSHNNGLTMFDPNGGCSSITSTIDVLTSTSFYNVYIDNPQSCGYATVATAAGDSINATNDFTHNAGAISGIFEVKGNFTVGTGTDGGLGKIIMNGTGAQTYTTPLGTRTCHLMVNKTSGAVTPAIGTTYLGVQQFSFFAGTFTAPTGNFSVGGSLNSSITLFTHSGGTFIHNSGTLMLDPWGTCSGLTETIDVINSTSFYNVTINGVPACGGYSFATAAGDTVDAVNDLTHSDGSINGLFSVKNNLILGAASDGGFGKIIMDGAGAQTYLSSGTVRTCHLMINKTAGTVTPTGGTTYLGVQQFSLLAGSFTAPPTTFSIGGSTDQSLTLFLHSGGTFIHNNSTTIFQPWGTCSGLNETIDVITSTSFYSVEINGVPSCGSYSFLTAAGDTVDVTHDLTHTDGLIGGLFSVKNNLILGVASDGGFGKIIMDGTGAQTYSSPGTVRTCHLMINKTAGTVTPTGGTTYLGVQQFSLLAGSFTAPPTTFSIGGSTDQSLTLFLHSGGTFIHNNSTTIFQPTGTCSPLNETIDVINATSFYNVTLNGVPSCGSYNFLTGAGDTVDVTNDLTHADGYINGLFSLKNNLILGTASDGGFGKIIMDGTGAQTYSSPGTVRTCHLIINKSAGTVTPTGGTTYLGVQQFSLLAGTFTAPSATFSIGGSTDQSLTLFLHSGGTFIHNNTSTFFNPSGACSFYTMTIDVISSTSFYNLTVNGAVSCGVTYTFAQSAGDTLDVRNDLTLSRGALNNSYVECKGNVTIQTNFNGGSTVLILNGSNNTTLDATGGTGNFNADVRIAKQYASNTVALQSVWLLDAASQDITFSKGRIVASSSNYLNLGDNVTALSFSDSSFVDGYVRKTGNDAFTFPIGSGSVYAPLTISAPTVLTDHFTANYFNVDPATVPYNVSSRDVTLHHISRSEYWILDRTNGSSTVFVTLSWAARSHAVTALAELRVARWDGSVWRDHGNGGTTGNTTAGTVISSAAVGSFSPFTLASTTANNPLPVQLLSFDAVSKEDVVDLTWITASETNNDYFTIQRSKDALLWENLGQVTGAGNSAVSISYKEVDIYPYTGISYYRLKQTDFNGGNTYSNIRAVDRNEENIKILHVYPSPENGSMMFTIYSPDATEMLIDLYSLTGQQALATSKHLEKGINKFAVDTKNFSTGNYLLRMQADHKTYTDKLSYVNNR